MYKQREIVLIILLILALILWVNINNKNKEASKKYIRWITNNLF